MFQFGNETEFLRGENVVATALCRRNGTGNTPVATAISISARSPVTRDSFCNRTRRFGLRTRVKGGKTRQHPNCDGAGRTSTGSSERAGTNAPPEASACYASHEMGVRIASEDERKRRPPGS